VPAAPAAALRERLLLVVLYITVLASSVAFIEPSPHDAMMGVLALACLIAGLRFERHVALLFLLLLIWNVAGLLSLIVGFVSPWPEMPPSAVRRSASPLVPVRSRVNFIPRSRARLSDCLAEINFNLAGRSRGHHSRGEECHSLPNQESSAC